MRYRELLESVAPEAAYYDPDEDRINGRQSDGPCDAEYFIGSIDRVFQILAQCGDTASLATQLWTVSFDDSSTRDGFLQIWSDARRLDELWIVPDVLALEWLREWGGVRLYQCVEIRFPSRKARTAFIDKAENSSVRASADAIGFLKIQIL